ncbi:uncharacterized protein E0L32_000987 [Thyridium curvatum]|uniref:Uncharacterized protein n=1 Tax=Thyridium curvatum TaxID=1093900 RepID=A0A507B1L2_9PEZI|nr:uncharacterized protein E0L32_000987 [Thyridium curvatum]TPX11169.1 hypothetical protein E0L32_000987 [Thyridium curvatum]
MDAQNAVDAASTKPAASPKHSAGADPDQATKTTSLTKSPTSVRSSPPVKESRSGAAHPQAQDDDGADANSEAETIVLYDKNGNPSPSKSRKMIKHEDKSDGEGKIEAPAALKASGSRSREGDRSGQGGARDAASAPPSAASHTGKKKTSQENKRTKDGSSGLSSAPASPPHHHRPRRLSTAHPHPHPDSDSDSVRAKSPRLPSAVRDKARSVDRLVSHKRKAPKAESDDEGESRKARRQRTALVGLDNGNTSNKTHREHKTSASRPHHETNQSSRNRSISPQPRAHRRSISTQLPSNGLSHKKKRVPAPLQSTDYHSDESSASGSPHIRSSKLRSLTTPATAESTISPAKMAPHKKHLDAHGQTFLARACARGEYDGVKQRLAERPEDLNVADFAGNTPLQIASINGYDDIVKLLIEAGCNLDCVNYDKDTPLLDAVDNGHLEVVKLLLDAGVNPRKANVNGEEPLDRITDDLENATEIRAALVNAKKKMGERRFTSEDNFQDASDTRASHGPESPRRSPPASSLAHQVAASRRAGTVRANKTSNHLLYMPMDDKTLRQAAGRGDEETVTRILQVRDTFDDPESMVAAARGGHDIVMQLLLALGNANPDPAGVTSVSPDVATPMLAAIGQENIKVIRLLLDQTSFDPTRKFRGETYYEIARRRQGPNWKEEEHMLKDAYDAYKKTHKDSAKTKSPARRDLDRDSKRAGRSESRDESARAHKRKLSSPTRETKKAASSKAPTSPKDKRRSNSFSAHHDTQSSPRRGPGRPKKDDRPPTIAISDREVSPPSKHSKPRRAESDLAALSSEGETMKPRRKLVSGRELKGERDKQRRASMASTASSLKEPSSPRDSRHDDVHERLKGEKYHDRTKQLKRDESRDRLSVSGEGSGKRHRSSATPPHHPSSEKEGGEGPVKRRRLDVEGREKRQKSTSLDDRPHKSAASRDPSANSSHRDRDDAESKSAKQKKRDASSDRSRRESGKSNASEKSIHVKSEDVDIEMHDVDQPKEGAEIEARVAKDKESDKKKQAEAEQQALEARKAEEEQKRREEEERKRKEEEEAEAKRREELEKKQRLEEEKRKAEEEEKRKKEEEEKRRKEEEERKRLEAEEEQKRREEEERKKREEEERLRREQLEREAAEEARRKREEEEKKEQERRERAQREEMERRRAAREAERAAREAEQRRIFEEQERIRLSKLPPLLRWLDTCANPKSPEVAQKFSKMQGVRYDCIRPEATGKPDGREQWLLNTQVALLLGEKDLDLSRYTAWERIPVSMIAKKTIWRLEADRYALTTQNLFDIGKQLPDYYEGHDPDTMSYTIIERLRKEAWPLFASLEMFFVKASELMYIIPTMPHLRNIKLSMAYRELPESEAQMMYWAPTQKWKSDPDADRFHGFAPRNKYFVNGAMVSEDKPGLSAVSKTPFPEKRVPRRGLKAVTPDDPDYDKICREQGLEHLISGSSSPTLPNGVQFSPVSQSSTRHGAPAGLSTEQTAQTLLNGDGQHQLASPTTSLPGTAPGSHTGVNGNHVDAVAD